MMTPTPWKGRLAVFVLTYLAYMTIHIVRKPSSVLKSVLHPQDSYDAEYKPGWGPFNQDLVPGKVAEVGFKVSGSGVPEVDGAYRCIQDHAKGAPCYRFQLEHNGSFVIERTKGAICKWFVDDTYIKPWCWTLSSYPPGFLPKAPLFAQLYAGELPRPLSSSDVHLEDKAWKQKQGDSKLYDPVVDMRVQPDVQDGKVLLGLMDTTFLLSYTVGLFASGYIADRVDIRKFLAAGMVSAGISSIFLGLAHRMKVHSFSYFLIVSIWGGFSQSVGWPCVITVMGRWFPRTYPNRGSVMGVWSTNIFIGNILGSVITTAAVGWGMKGENWPLGFELPGVIVLVCGLLVFGFLKVHPHGIIDVEEEQDSLSDPLVDSESNQALASRPAPTFLRALTIPGVIPYSLSLMFAKFAQYALLYWGPYYLQVVGFSSERAGYLCSFFDVGALLGSIAATWSADKLKRSGLTAALFLVAATISLFVYYSVTNDAGEDIPLHIAFMILAGFWVNGPATLIMTSVSQDLGYHPSLNGDKRLIASVTGIIDGTGSFGAAMQGVLIGILATSSWEQVFSFLAVCCLISASLLGGVVKREIFNRSN